MVSTPAVDSVGAVNSLGIFARARPQLTGFFAVYVVAIGSYGLVVGARLTVSYLVIVGVLAVVVAMLDTEFDLGTAVCWLLAVWGLAHMAGGIIELEGDRILYNVTFGWEFIQFDRLVHAFGFGTATLATGRVLRHRLSRISPAVVVIVMLGGMGVGAINEVIEFIAAKVLDDTNVGGFDNTGWDLVFNTMGAIGAGLHWRSHPAPPGTP